MYLAQALALPTWLAFAAVASAQLQPARIVILVGPPGSGKTVQAEYLRKRFQVPVISMAQILQSEVNKKSALGKALKVSLASGDLVGDETANELMKTRLLNTDTRRGFILDGYPASEGQARALDMFIADQSFAKPVIIVLDVPDEVVRERMLRRRRVDDTPTNIDRRLAEYRRIGRLVEGWYGAERTIRVDGTGAASAIAQQIANGIETLRSRPALKEREAGGLQPRP
jgi:adenylate kinase